MSTSEEDCSYLSNLIEEALEEEFPILAYYTRYASTVLVIGGLGHWYVFLSDQRRKKKRLVDESVSNLTLQWYTYIQKLHKVYVSLTGIGDALSDFNLSGLLVDHVKLLTRDVETKDKAFGLRTSYFIYYKGIYFPC